MLQDVRFALRSLAKAPLFTAVVIVTLALGLGANTATFSILKSISLNPLPYRDADRLVVLAQTDGRTLDAQGVSAAALHEWRRRSRLFETICLWGDNAIRPVIDGRADFLRGMGIDYDYFDALGIKMHIGRTLTEEDNRPETAQTLILSYGLWLSRFGGDPKVIGRTIPALGGSEYTIVGVLPADFHPLHMSNPGEIPQIFVPLKYNRDDPLCRDCDGWGGRAIGRLKGGVTYAQARADLNAIMRDCARQFPDRYGPDAAVLLTPLREKLMGRFDNVLLILFGAVGLLLLLACANVANLLLVRATGRRAEMALRASLGAARWRLVRLMLTETLLLALAGGILGVGCAVWVTRLIGRWGASEIPRVDEIGPDLAMLGWGIAVSVVTGLLFGLLPALEASRLDLRSVLQGSTNASRGRANQNLLHSLITAEIVLAFVLVVGVGLLGKSYARLTGVDAGFDAHNVVTLSVLPKEGVQYEKPEQLLALYDAVVQRMRTIPSVEDAGYASTLPLSNTEIRALYIREKAISTAAEAPQINVYSVSAGYLRTMKISLLRGRMIDERDKRGLAPAALVSESCARKQFGGGDPIGQHIQLDSRDDKQPWATIVGVVKDVHQYGLDKAGDPAVYRAFAQTPEPQGWARLVVRSRLSPERIEPAVKEAMRAVAPLLPIFHLQPMDAYTAKSIAQRTFALYLMIAFGALALLLATIGIYGVVSYAVGLRTREVGIRMALGAKPADVSLMIMGQVLLTVMVGLMIGLGVALYCGQFVKSLLFGVTATDWWTFMGAVALIASVALAASFIPAQRAARLNPVTAMRVE